MSENSFHFRQSENTFHAKHRSAFVMIEYSKRSNETMTLPGAEIPLGDPLLGPFS